MNLLKTLLMATCLLSIPVFVTACEQESPTEEAIGDVGEAIEEVGDEIDDATTN